MIRYPLMLALSVLLIPYWITMGLYIKKRLQVVASGVPANNGTLRAFRFVSALALLCLVAGLSGVYIPGSGNSMVVHNAEIVVVLDVSNSMNMQGMSETTSALSDAKDHIRSILSAGGDFLVSFIAYKGQAIEVVPSTPVRGFVFDALEWASSAAITTKGTSLRGALDLVLANMNAEYSLVLIYTDGNSPAPDKQLADLYVRGADVHIIGCGSDTASSIKNPEGNLVVDTEGKTVRLARNRREMEAWARKGKAHYHDLEDEETLTTVLSKIQKVSASRGTSIVVSKPVSATKYFALSAFLLLAVGYVLFLKTGSSRRGE